MPTTGRIRIETDTELTELEQEIAAEAGVAPHTATIAAASAAIATLYRTLSAPQHLLRTHRQAGFTGTTLRSTARLGYRNLFVSEYILVYAWCVCVYCNNVQCNPTLLSHEHTHTHHTYTNMYNIKHCETSPTVPLPLWYIGGQCCAVLWHQSRTGCAHARWLRQREPHACRLPKGASRLCRCVPFLPRIHPHGIDTVAAGGTGGRWSRTRTGSRAPHDAVHADLTVQVTHSPTYFSERTIIFSPLTFIIPHSEHTASLVCIEGSQ